MDRMEDRCDPELIDLGAVSEETQGAGAVDIEGFQLRAAVGISDE